MVRGEGVRAFSRALLSSGAGAALTTLWRVDDQSTSEFMKQFYYFALEKHKPKAEALRLAKLTLLKSNTAFQNPSNWAAFVLSGDGLTPLPRVYSWSEIVLSGLVLVAALSAIFSWLRSRRRVNRQHRSRAAVTE